MKYNQLSGLTEQEYSKTNTAGAYSTTKINNVMEAYNARLAALVTNKDGTRKLRLLSPMDYFSGKSNL